MSNPASIAASACAGQKQPTLSFQQLASKYKNVLNNMNLGHCKTDSDDTSNAFTSSGGGFLTGSWSDSVTDTDKYKSTVGCSAVNVLLQAYNSAVENVKCIISQDTSNETVNISNTNSVTFNAPITLFSCPTLNINQNIGGNMNIIAKIDPQTTISIQQAIADHIHSFTNALTDMYSGQPSYGTDGQGTQNVNQMLSNETQTNIANQIKDTIENLSISINNQNQVVINAPVVLIINGDSCNFTQNIAVDIMTNTIVSSAFSTALDAVSPSSMMPPLPYPPPSTSSKSSPVFETIVIVLLILALIGGGIYYFKFYKKQL